MGAICNRCNRGLSTPCEVCEDELTRRRRKIFPNVHTLPPGSYSRSLDSSLDHTQNQGSPPHFLNDMLDCLWPYITDYAIKMLKKSVEPTIQGALGSLGKSFTFIERDCSFGSTLKIECLTLNNLGRATFTENGKLTNLLIKAQVSWGRDVKISLTMAKATLGIKRLTFSGDLYVECVGMIPRPPMFLGARVYFVNPPSFSFSFLGAAHIFNQAKTLIQSVLLDKVSQKLVVPNQICKVLDKTFDVSAVHCANPVGMLELTVIKACSLHAADMNFLGKRASDPYCVIRCGAYKSQTEHCPNTVDPVFSHTVILPIWNPTGQIVTVEVYDRDAMSQDDLLGKASVYVDEMMRWGQKDRAVNITGPDDEAGDFGLLWCNASWTWFKSGLRHTPDEQGSFLLDAGGLVSACVYGVSHLSSEHRGTRFWILAQCTNLQSQSSTAETQTTARKGPDKKENTAVDADMEVLMKKVRVLQKYNMHLEDMAEILEVNPVELKPLATTGKHTSFEEMAANMITSHEIVWNHNFLFLVNSLREAKLTFTLMCLRPDEAALGSITCLLADLVTPDNDELSSPLKYPEENDSPFQVGSKTLKLGSTDILLTLRMSVHAPRNKATDGTASPSKTFK